LSSGLLRTYDLSVEVVRLDARERQDLRRSE
jgi:hypothetical protein